MPRSVRVLGCYDAFPTESKVDEDIGKLWSIECHVRLEFLGITMPSRSNLKLMKILASDGQSNVVFGSGFRALRCIPERI